MLVLSNTRRLPVVAFLAVWAVSALAQEDAARPSYSRLLNIDALIDNHARFLARRYDLSEEQEEFTLVFLHQNADAFLAKRREDLYGLVDRLVEVRAGGEMTTDDLVVWGKQALPLYEEAKALIVQGNDDWREILTVEQRKIHDEDLAEMYESFSTTEEQLARIVSGGMTVEEFRTGPARHATSARGPRTAPRVSTNPPSGVTQTQDRQTPAPGVRPPTPTRARPIRSTPEARSGASTDRGGPESATRRDTPARPSHRTSPRSGGSSASPTDFESKWEAYVRDFIEKYQLDEGQTQRAQAILKDCQELAQRQIQKRKPELERLDKMMLDLAKSPDKDQLKELGKIRDRKAKLLEPIDRIFEKMLKPRLEKLPTRAQRQAAEAPGSKRDTHRTPPGPQRTPPKPVETPEPTPDEPDEPSEEPPE